MANEDVERRLEKVARDAARTRETQEFLQGLTKNDELVKPIYHPEAWIVRDKLRAAANRGDLHRTECKHPLAHLRQFIDEDPSIKRAGQPVNLFECGVCHMTIWFCDPWGEAVSDE